MRPAAATIWKYLLEREQSPEGVPLFTKFYVGCRERKKERKKGKKKKKNGWKGERKQQEHWKRLEEGGVRTWSDSGCGRKKGVGGGGVEKEKMPDEKEQKGRKRVRWLSGCRAKNTGRVVSGWMVCLLVGIQLGRYLSWISYPRAHFLSLSYL